MTAYKKGKFTYTEAKELLGECHKSFMPEYETRWCPEVYVCAGGGRGAGYYPVATGNIIPVWKNQDGLYVYAKDEVL